MSTVLLSEENSLPKNAFQTKCDNFSKQCAVLLGFVIPVSTTATHVVLFFLLINWFLAGNFSEKIKISIAHPVSKAALILFGVFVTGTFYSAAPLDDKIFILGKMGKLLYLPFLLPLFMEEKWRRSGMAAFVGAMLLTLILSMLKLYANLPISTRFTEACVFKDHIYTNFMMAFAGFVVGHYGLQSKNGWERFALSCLLSGFVFYVFFMSKGRTGYIIFALLWLLFFLQRISFKGIILGTIGLILLVGLAFKLSYPLQEGFGLVINNIEQYQAGDSNTSVGARLEFFTQTWDLAKQHPWFGYGTGSFRSVYETHATANQLLLTDNPHNEYLNIFFQLGLFGFAAFIGFFILLGKLSFRLPKPEQWIAQGALGAMILGCLANSWLLDFTSGYFFVIIIAFSFGALKRKEGSFV